MVFLITGRLERYCEFCRQIGEGDWKNADVRLVDRRERLDGYRINENDEVIWLSDAQSWNPSRIEEIEKAIALARCRRPEATIGVDVGADCFPHIHVHVPRPPGISTEDAQAIMATAQRQIREAMRT
jgi:hypothetical protein